MMTQDEATAMARKYLQDEGNLCSNCNHELRYNVASCNSSLTINVFCPNCGERAFMYRECSDGTTINHHDGGNP